MLSTMSATTLPEPATTRSTESNAAAQVLHDVFGYAEFRGEQAAIIDHVVAGGDALVLMPTGGGKSLCFQVPAIVRHRAGHGAGVGVEPGRVEQWREIYRFEIAGFDRLHFAENGAVPGGVGFALDEHVAANVR